MTPSSSDANQSPAVLHEPSILFTDLGLGVKPPADGRRAETGRLDGGTAGKLLRREGGPRLRSGWYAYRVTGPATLPSWAVEVALSVERPGESHPMQRVASQDGEAVPAWAPELGAPGGATFPAAGSPSPGQVRPRGRAAHPQKPYPYESPVMGLAVQAVVLLRAPARMSWLAQLADAAAEVEAAAGIRRGANADALIAKIVGTPPRPPEGTRSLPIMGTRSRLHVGPPLPGLVPISAVAAELHLATAGARGLPAPLRRWTPAAGRKDQTWRAGAGCVLTCDGPDDVSAQAVVALGGAGDPEAIRPLPGGALVLRAWRARHAWGAACALVLGASEAVGLGREGGRVAARARGAGWDAVALQGLAAMQMARAGDHRAVAPQGAARAALGPQVARLFEACLTAADRGRPASGSGSSWAWQ